MVSPASHIEKWFMCNMENGNAIHQFLIIRTNFDHFFPACCCYMYITHKLYRRTLLTRKTNTCINISSGKFILSKSSWCMLKNWFRWDIRLSTLHIHTTYCVFGVYRFHPHAGRVIKFFPLHLLLFCMLRARRLYRAENSFKFIYVFQSPPKPTSSKKKNLIIDNKIDNIHAYTSCTKTNKLFGLHMR